MNEAIFFHEEKSETGLRLPGQARKRLDGRITVGLGHYSVRGWKWEAQHRGTVSDAFRGEKNQTAHQNKTTPTHKR